MARDAFGYDAGVFESEEMWKEENMQGRDEIRDSLRVR